MLIALLLRHGAQPAAVHSLVSFQPKNSMTSKPTPDPRSECRQKEDHLKIDRCCPRQCVRREKAERLQEGRLRRKNKREILGILKATTAPAATAVMATVTAAVATIAAVIAAVNTTTKEGRETFHQTPLLMTDTLT